jgi:hypothetical protein
MFYIINKFILVEVKCSWPPIFPTFARGPADIQHGTPLRTTGADRWFTAGCLSFAIFMNDFAFTKNKNGSSEA